MDARGTHGWVLIQKKRQRDNIFTKAIRRVSMTGAKKNWKKRYLVATGSLLCMFASERAFRKTIAELDECEGKDVTIESRAKHLFHVDPSCTCAPAMTSNQGCFVITLPAMMQSNAANVRKSVVDNDRKEVTTVDVADEEDESSSDKLLLCVSDRGEMQHWVAAIGRAIRISIDATVAQEVMERHNQRGLLRTSSGRFDVSGLGEMMRRKSLNDLEVSAIRQLMVTMKEEGHTRLDPNLEKSSNFQDLASPSSSSLKSLDFEDAVQVDETFTFDVGLNDGDTMSPLTQTRLSTSEPWYAAFPFQGNIARGEIDLNAGDCVHVIDHLDNGWWYVTKESSSKTRRQGRVPGGYLTQDVDEIRLNFGRDAVISGSLGRDRYYVAIHNYTTNNIKEMSFLAGDHMEVLERHRNGWWLARKAESGKIGFVPKNYLISGTTPTHRSDRSASRDLNILPKVSTTGELEDSATLVQLGRHLQARFDYKAQTENEIDVTKGDLVYVINDNPAIEWTLCELNGRKGYVPRNYLKEIEAREVESVTSEAGTEASASSQAPAVSSSSSLAKPQNQGWEEAAANSAPVTWQSSVASMPSAVKGLLQKKVLNSGEVDRVREMMQMLKVSKPQAHLKSSATSGVVHQAAPGQSFSVETVIPSSDAVEFADVHLWDSTLREWCDLEMKILGVVLRCASGLSQWSLTLDSSCDAERVPNPSEFFSFAECSSSSDDDAVEDEFEQNKTKRRLSKEAARKNLFCLRIFRLKGVDENNKPSIHQVGTTTFEQIVGFESLSDCEKMQMHLERIVECAVESELDQLMIFADEDLSATANKVSKVSALVSGLVKRFEAAKARTGRLGGKSSGASMVEEEVPPARPPRNRHKLSSIETLSSASTEVVDSPPSSPNIQSEFAIGVPKRPPRKSKQGSALNKKGSLHQLMLNNLSDSMDDIVFNK